MTNQNDDLLIAEIEKMIAAEKEEARLYDDEVCPTRTAAYTALENVIPLVKADRARQQAEKEKMIAELKALKAKNCNNYYRHYETGIDHSIAIIQGKEQKEEREASK